jgi:alkanesulfonate monooxygenase SsuD/methylene tetrahydromethanopterin reductase-like flavin-dependent oxidoreductase (luciferase family)
MTDMPATTTAPPTVVARAGAGDGDQGNATPWFGLFLPQLRMSFPTIVERTVAAEAAGFDSLWLIDHLATPMGREYDLLEGWTLAAALAARTTRIRIGHLVTCDPFRHPALLAKMAVTVDAISDGRLELGLGWGSVVDELQTYGMGDTSAAARSARMRESLEVLGLMFSGEPFSYDGAHFQLDDALGRPRPVQAHIPVHIGGGGPKLTMPLVRDFADWWNCPAYAFDRLAELRPLAGAARVSIQHPIGLAATDTDRDEVVALAERRFGGWGALIAGTPAEVAATLAAEVEAGIEGFVLQFHDFGEPATIDRFMAAVAPEVRAAAPR